MAKLELELHRENRPVETIRLDSDRVLIGSEAYCDLRLHSDEAAPEQALLEVEGRIVRVTARSVAPGLLLDGKRATRGTLASGGTLGLAKVAIRIWIDRGHQEGSGKKSQSRRHLVIGGAALVLVLVVGLMFLDDPARKAKPTAPPLWTQASATCPASRPLEALTAAGEKQTLAQAKAQRHPFIAREGMDSVQLYRVAAACARVAGTTDMAAVLTAEADSLQRGMDADYRVRRLRLEYSLRINDKQTTAREASMLSALLRGRDDPYTRWVTSLDTKLRASAPSRISTLAGALP